MKKLLLLILLILVTGRLFAQEEAPKPDKDNSLVILWTTAEKDVFTKMIYIYALNTIKNKSFDEVILIVWGPSAKLLAEDKELQGMLAKLKEAGVVLEACKWCSDQYEVSGDLEACSIDVKYMGKPLTEYIKTGKNVLVF